MGRLSTAFLTSAALLVMPVMAQAAPPDEDPLAEARDLYNQGQNCFDLADYLCAIDKWTNAYGKTPNEPEHMQIRIALLNNLATAREKAYDLTGEVIHLKQARELLARFKDNISGLEMDPSEEAEQVARIDERLAAIDQTLDGGEDPGEPDQPEEPEQPEGPTEQPGPGTDGPEENDQPGRPLVIAGATMLGLGVVAGGVSFALMGVGAGLNDLEDREYTVQEREDLENQGDSINGAAWATGITGIALVGAGAVLTAIGVSKNNKAKSNVAVAPYGSPTGAGLSLRARF